MPRFFDTATRAKKEFVPQRKGEVKMYACGPTVYWYQHIGNLRTYTNEDVFRRLLEHHGYKVHHVMNLTDVGHLTSDADTGEDKMEVAVKREHKTPAQIAQFYTDAFFTDAALLRIERPTTVCRATEHVPEMIELIKVLEQKGFTYRTDTGVFFDTSKFPDYAKFAKLHLEKQKTARSEVVRDHGKRQPWDFALWFYDKPEHSQQWDTPWGRGYPGWHIECSAMSLKYGGPTLDVHWGGVDHIPVHHTNEIAQSTCATGKPFAHLWMHNAHLQVADGKMSKSAGHLVRPTDLAERGVNPMALRLLYLMTHYRTTLQYTDKALDDAQKAHARLQNFVSRVNELCEPNADPTPAMEKTLEDVRTRFFDALDDDLDTPKALQVLFDFVNTANARADEGAVTGGDAHAIKAFLREADSVLAVMDLDDAPAKAPTAVLELVEARERARRDKDFAKADALRDQIREKGFLVQDTPDGPKLKKA